MREARNNSFDEHSAIQLSKSSNDLAQTCFTSFLYLAIVVFPLGESPSWGMFCSFNPSRCMEHAPTLTP